MVLKGVRLMARIKHVGNIGFVVKQFLNNRLHEAHTPNYSINYGGGVLRSYYTPIAINIFLNNEHCLIISTTNTPHNSWKDWLYRNLKYKLSSCTILGLPLSIYNPIDDRKIWDIPKILDEYYNVEINKSALKAKRANVWRETRLYKTLRFINEANSLAKIYNINFKPTFISIPEETFELMKVQLSLGDLNNQSDARLKNYLFI
jgi:hypothetical protein